MSGCDPVCRPASCLSAIISSYAAAILSKVLMAARGYTYIFQGYAVSCKQGKAVSNAPLIDNYYDYN